MAVHENMSSKFYLISLFALLTSVCAKEYVPVLLWESSATGSEDVGSRPALTKWPTDDFADYIARKVNSYKEKPLIVVFSEENLSIEDFSWHDELEQGSFPQVESLTKKSTRVNFFPSVHAPLRAFKVLVNEGYTYRAVDLNNNMNEPITASDGTVLVIKLDDPESVEDRPTFLSRHDKIIGKIYNDLLLNHPRILAVYTARYASFLDTDPEPIHRVRRLASENITTLAEGESKLWRDAQNRVFIYFGGPYPLLTDKSDNTTLELKTFTSVPTVDDRDSLQRFVVMFLVNTRQIILRFRFTMSPSRYWSLPTIEYEDKLNNKQLILETSDDIEAPNNFSYHCGSNMTFRNSTVTLTLNNVQMQPFLQSPRFSDSYDCVWFFTAPIWSGIFVTFLFALILTWGITMIMDIRTMDRFDDPKGKTITISAAD